MVEKLDNYNEKFTFAMQSFQSTVGNLSTRLTETKEQVGLTYHQIFRLENKIYVFVKIVNFCVSFSLKNQFVSNKDFELSEKKIDRLQSDLSQTDTQINALKESIRSNSNSQEQQASKIKEINDTIYKLDNVQIPAINTRLGQLATKDEFNNLKTESQEKVF